MNELHQISRTRRKDRQTVVMPQLKIKDRDNWERIEMAGLVRHLDWPLGSATAAFRRQPSRKEWYEN